MNNKEQIWEEKSYIDQNTNSLMSEESDNLSIITETKRESTKRQCDDIGKTKTCNKCNTTKPIVDFYKQPRNTDGYKKLCKMCFNNIKKSYYHTNKEKIKKRYKLYRIANRDKIHSYNKEYRKNNRTIRSERAKIKYNSDINTRLRSNLRCRLYQSLNLYHKSGSAVQDLGCSVPALKLYLESKFQPGMTWNNYGKFGWHIDHIKPLSKFDLSDRKQLLEAVHYTNLQPLWADDNLKKGNHVTEI